MASVPLQQARRRLAELARRVEAGERVTVTRRGKPAFDLVPHVAPKSGGLDFAAGPAYLKSLGYTEPFFEIAEDFDAPLPEDFLLRPLP